MAFQRSEILRSFIWKLSERFSVQGISFLVSICLARMISPAEYGEIALIMVFINIANVIIDGGFNTALIQKKEVDDVDFSTVFYITFATTSVLYISMFLTAPAIASFYKSPSLELVIKVTGSCLFAYAFNSIQRAYISRHMLFKNLFLSSLCSTVTAGAIGIILAYKGLGIWALVLHYITSCFTLSLVMLITVKWRPRLRFSTDRFWALFDYGWKIFLSNFMISLFVNIRSLIIGRMYAPAFLAYFERGKQIPSLIMDNINASMQAILLPVFSVEQDNTQQIKSMLRRSIRTSSITIFPLLIGLFTVAKPLTIIMLTEKWADAIPFIRIFCIALVMMPLQTASIEALKAIGRSDMLLKLEFIKKVLEVSILISSIFISVYAIAIGVIVYNFICIFINTYANKKLLGYTLRQMWTDVCPPLMAALGMGTIVSVIEQFPWNNYLILLAQLFTGIASYILICELFKIESFRYIKQNILKRSFFKTRQI